MLRKREYIEAEKIIEKYKEKYITCSEKYIENSCCGIMDEKSAEEKLRMQFYFAVKGMCVKNAAISYYKMAASITSDIYCDGSFYVKKLNEYKLSINEINFYVEAVLNEDDMQKKVKIIDIFISYLDRNYYDLKNKAKILPKLVVYYCRINDNIVDIGVLWRMWKLCCDAVQLLRNDKKSYYIIELFEIQINIADKLCRVMNGSMQSTYCEQIMLEKRKIKSWYDVMVKEYKYRGIPINMPNDFYIYQEGIAYCINDVVRARRNLLGYNRKSLCEGICAEKTIEKTEQHKSNLQYTNMKLIYDRLNLPCTYQYSSLVVSNILDLEKEEEIDDLSANEKFACALASIEDLKKSIPLYAYNLQQLGRLEILIMNQLGKITVRAAIEQIIRLLELTVPVKTIDNFIENKKHGLMRNEKVNRRIYFTQSELECIISIANYYNELGECGKADKYMELLYEYFIDNFQCDDVYGMENIFCLFMLKYTSMLGDCDKYELSDKLADMVIKHQLELYRPQKIWWHKYNNLWNDKVKENDKEKYNMVLGECALLCQIYDNESMEKLFNDKMIKII